MRIEQSGRDGASAQIDAPSVRPGDALDLGGRADGDDAIAGDRDRLRDAIVRIDGEHAAVDEMMSARVAAPRAFALTAARTSAATGAMAIRIIEASGESSLGRVASTEMRSARSARRRRR